jgi:O-acetylhomoserine (thiol)-lyase
MSPMTAFQLLQGIETLPLRMQRHVDNTRKVVAHLAAHAAVESVSYPELPSHPDHALAKRLLPRGCGSVFSFVLKGGRPAGGSSSNRCASSRTSPTSATRSRW